MISVLMAGPQARDETVREGRPGRTAGKARRAVTARQLPVDRLSVVSMNISDDVQAGYDAQNDEPHTLSEHSKNGRKPPTRHFVSGHLFLARNGQMTYRRAHWRGEVQLEPTIYRVK